MRASGSAAKKCAQKTQNIIKEINFIRPYVNSKNIHKLPGNLLLLPSLEQQNDNEEDIKLEKNLNVVGDDENYDLIIIKKKNIYLKYTYDDIDSCVIGYIKEKRQSTAE